MVSTHAKFESSTILRLSCRGNSAICREGGVNIFLSAESCTVFVFMWVFYLLLSWYKNYKLIANSKSWIVKYWLRRISYNFCFELRTSFLIDWEVLWMSVYGLRILATASGETKSYGFRRRDASWLLVGTSSFWMEKAKMLLFGFFHLSTCWRWHFPLIANYSCNVGPFSGTQNT